MTINIRKIVPLGVKVYLAPDVFLGSINEYELNDLRTQIKEEFKGVVDKELSEYYLIYNDGEVDHRVDICADGMIHYWPNGFFDLLDLQVDTLIGWGDTIKYNEAMVINWMVG